MDKVREAEFHCRQARLKHALRLAEDRPLAVDLLARAELVILSQQLASKSDKSQADQDLLDTIHKMIPDRQWDPVAFAESLSAVERKQVVIEAQERIHTLEECDYAQNEFVIAYWTQVIRMLKIISIPGFRQGIVPAVLEELDKLMTGKNVRDLEELQAQVKKLVVDNKPEFAADPEYWNQVALLIEFSLSRKVVLDFHSEAFRDLDLSRFRLSSFERIILPPLKLEQPSSVVQKKDPNAVLLALVNEALDEDEEIFDSEVVLEDQDPGLIKPQYMNRVQLAVEWTSYNQAHYDKDNPPPKIPFGYKFHVFYPELNASKTPTYALEKDPEDPWSKILRFKAGPPYQDIAFRISGLEWEMSHRRGFNSKFDRKILYLYFNLKQLKYRR